MRIRMIGSVFVAVLAVVASSCTVNPVTGKSELDLLGEARELELGRELYPKYTQVSLGEVDDQALQAYVQSVGISLARVSHRPKLPYEYNAVNDPDVNAYALPGGKISITRGLLARMDSEDELAAVLGHETGHVTARHSAAQYSRQVLAQLLLTGAAVYMEAKDVEHRELYLFGGMIGGSLLMARYSRDQERQADDLGFQYLIEAGYNPDGMTGVMEALLAAHEREPNLLERMFASHPLTTERLETARELVARQSQEVRNRPEHRRRYLDRSAQMRAARPAYDRVAAARRMLADDQLGTALRELRQAVDELPNDGVPRAFLATAEAEAKRGGAAMRSAARGANDARKVYFAQTVAGQVFFDNRRWAEALSFLNRALEILPEQAEAEMMRGRTLENMGREGEAAESYNRVQQLVPGTDLAREADRRARAL